MIKSLDAKQMVIVLFLVDYLVESHYDFEIDKTGSSIGVTF